MRSRQPIRAVQREVKKLENIGLLKKTAIGNRIYYKADKSWPIYEELKGIIFKSLGVAEALKTGLAVSDNVMFAFIYGSYAVNKESSSSDIDLMVIGDISSKGLSGILRKPKAELSREINYAVFKPTEFKSKVNNKNHFLSVVLKQKKIFIIGSENELKRFIRSQ